MCLTATLETMITVSFVLLTCCTTSLWSLKSISWRFHLIFITSRSLTLDRLYKGCHLACELPDCCTALLQFCEQGIFFNLFARLSSKCGCLRVCFIPTTLYQVQTCPTSGFVCCFNLLGPLIFVILSNLHLLQKQFITTVLIGGAPASLLLCYHLTSLS